MHDLSFLLECLPLSDDPFCSPSRSTTTLDVSSPYRDLATSEGIELREFHTESSILQAGAQETTRERKRREKLEQLREADEMKFSHSLQFNAVPDWSNHYIAYSNLKKQYVVNTRAQ